MTPLEIRRTAVKKIVRNLFKNGKGEPFELTDGQADIFIAVTDPHYKWVWTSAPSRFGKSETIAMALLYLAVSHHLKIPVVGGSEEKANKIMEYVLSHIPDSPELYNGLLNIKGYDKAELLKVQASKQVLRWATGGWIYITSIDARTISNEGQKSCG